MSKNRQQRRHPTHPAIPLLQPSGEKVPTKKKIGNTNQKKTANKKVKKVLAK